MQQLVEGMLPVCAGLSPYDGACTGNELMTDKETDNSNNTDPNTLRLNKPVII